MVGYMCAKKNSMLSLISSFDSNPVLGCSDGVHGGLLMPLRRLWTFAERLVARCVSRNSLMTLALDPFGPFFWGMALYVQVN